MARNLLVRQSKIHGNGVFAARDLPKGLRLIQYRGALRRHEEIDQCYGGDSESGHTFLFTLNEDWVIDANVDGNSARWLNHSCMPNCEAVHYEDDADRSNDKVYIETVRAIREGEELTYDYGITLDEAHTARMKKIWACRCGHRKCTGTMLTPKTRAKSGA